MAASDMQMDRAALMQWLTSEGGNNSTDIDYLKKVLGVCLEECISEKQRTYIMHYFFDSLTTSQIACMYGINKSTVSRVIKRGMKKIFEHLRFAYPYILNSSEFQMQTRLKKG